MEKERDKQVSWMSRQSKKHGQSMKILGLFLLSSLPEGINEILELWPLFQARGAKRLPDLISPTTHSNADGIFQCENTACSFGIAFPRGNMVDSVQIKFSQIWTLRHNTWCLDRKDQERSFCMWFSLKVYNAFAFLIPFSFSFCGIIIAQQTTIPSFLVRLARQYKKPA